MDKIPKYNQEAPGDLPRRRSTSYLPGRRPLVRSTSSPGIFYTREPITKEGRLFHEFYDKPQSPERTVPPKGPLEYHKQHTESIPPELPLDQYFDKECEKFFVNELQIQLGEELGRGGYGVVRKARDANDNEMAVKILESSRYVGGEGMAGLDAIRNEMLRELHSLSGLSHRHILSIDFAVHVRDPVSGFATLFLCIFMEMCAGSLDRELEERAMYEYEAYLWMSHIVSALIYLQTNRVKQVVHLNVKPENILYTWVDGYKVYKLTDFGQAKWFGLTQRKVGQTEARGDLRHAPELGTASAVVDFSKCDVFSLGVTLAESLIGFMGFDTEAYLNSETYEYEFVKWIEDSLIGTGSYFHKHELIVLLYGMLQTDPTVRMTFQEVSNWLTDVWHPEWPEEETY